MTQFTNNRQQIFPYSLKTVGLGDKVVISSGNRLGLEIINPQNLYSVEGLMMNFLMQMDVAAPGRYLDRVYVQDDFNTPTFQRKISGSPHLTPLDPNLFCEFKLDLSSLRNPSGRNVVVLEFDQNVQGTIFVWKLDMLYTVKGIYR